jgi:hypothetical protein
MALKVYYCKQDENPLNEHRIVPAPQLSISPELYYANDNVIGYTYNLSINGYAMARESGPTDYGLAPTVDSIAKIRDIFNVNGGNLYLKDEDNNDIFIAKGATIKKIDFSASDNKWVNYAPFSIEIEFNEVDFKGCDNNPIIGCSGSMFHTDQDPNTPIVSDHFADLKKYKIKAFNDQWTVNIDDQSYQNNYLIKVTYNLSATGKNYYVNNKLVPAWQQARLFVQDKLYKQVKSLISGILPINPSGNDGCSPLKDISGLYNPDMIAPKNSGIFEQFPSFSDVVLSNSGDWYCFEDVFSGVCECRENPPPGTVYKFDTKSNCETVCCAPLFNIYNETITCDTSEANGTFSITYNATLKRDNPSLPNSAIHTYSKTLTTNTEQNLESTINVKGSIQGLVRGGFVNTYNTHFILPQSGTLLTSLNSNETKYSNALSYYQTNIGSSSDLYDHMKQAMSITKGQLLINTDSPDDYIAKPSSFTIEHNYSDGTISYTANYDRATAIANQYGFTNISISRQDPIEVIQEFVVPGRAAGPIIQKLGMKTARTVSINIEGADSRNRGCYINNPCTNLPYTSIDENINNLLQESNSWVKTKEDYNVNRLDGSFTIALEFTIRDC